MSKTAIFALLLITLLALTACQAPAATGDTTALEARIAALEATVNGAEGSASAGDVAALTNRITVLEEAAAMAGGMEMDHGDATEVAEEATEHSEGEHGAETAAMSADPLFAVTMATYIMDTAGFHGMDEAINGEEVIDTSYAGTVARVSRLLSVTPWPADLAEEATTFQATLVEFGEALANDDVEAAKPLATRVHEEQHDFSHNIGAWINSQMGIEGGEHDH
jgi:hypothetical protein